MEAIILAGGLGTRLQAVVPDVPKPIAPIRGTPFLTLLLDRLAASSLITRVVLSLGYKAELIMDTYKNHSFPFDMRFVVEPYPLGTGGGTRHALCSCQEETVWVLNGDSLFTISFHDMWQFHQRQQSDLTLACAYVDDTSRYGSLFIDQNRILGFQEKQTGLGDGWINGGIYLLSRSLPFPAFEVFSLEKEFFPSILHHRVFGYCQAASFLDIGTRDSYLAAQQELDPCNPQIQAGYS